MCFGVLPSSFFPYSRPFLRAAGGVLTAIFLNPLSANPMCDTMSKMTPIIPLIFGGLNLVINLQNAKLYSDARKIRNENGGINFSACERFSEKVWNITRDISCISAGATITTSAMEIAHKIFFCGYSTETLPTITAAIQLPFLVLSILNAIIIENDEVPRVNHVSEEASDISSVTTEISNNNAEGYIL